MTSVETITDWPSFLRLEPWWNDTVARAAVPHPFLRHEWLRTWWECFGEGCVLNVLIARAGRRIQAIAPFLSESAHMYGVPIRRLRLWHNDQTPRADIILADGADDSYRAIWKHLLDRRAQWDVVQLGQLPAESKTRAGLSGLAAADGFASGVWQSGSSPYVAVSGTWDAYEAGLTPKFRQNIRNRLARVRKFGEPGLELVDRTSGATAIDAACDEAVRLEAAAWKRTAGTAICSDSAVDRLYRLFARRAAARGWLRLLFLRVGGRRIAASYSLCYHGRLFIFKTGYDPEYEKCSPFKLLAYFVLRDAFNAGLTEVDFLGDPEPWKLEWTPTTRPHDWLFIFSGSLRARLLFPLKFRVVPAIRDYCLAG
jgi:CelD/BcsL family acetyltransferase involved in cellulose biosynthesis